MTCAQHSQCSDSKINEQSRKHRIQLGDDPTPGAAVAVRHLVYSGTVEASIDGQLLCQFPTGGYFGKRALLDNARRAATVYCTQPTALLRLEK